MTTEQIKEKLEYGDYGTLARMLGLKNPAAAKMRFKRGDLQAKEALIRIIESREQLVESFQDSQEATTSNQ
ncbi:MULTISPECIES: hypothetical protein [Leeuwenhoekiella]|uniref:hypothetical protein n=1 Tax=Leeuwenhoekiella TaxID=283735 RepID=UPI000C350B81|nr:MULTISPECIES: hypothetical protein [Leeuwenhoekiella]MAO42126.1 hypothetical protein [Leeuwenhoekiella sp.]|tara:strand:- start:214 stop:426 length:213 start_codon:yes stop_codon:yes gene_type:complete